MYRHSHLHLLLLLLIITSSTSTAQSPPTKNNDTNIQSNDPSVPKPNISPSMSILIIILISAFIFFAFFSIYVRQYTAASFTTSSTVAPAPNRTRSIKRHGLAPEILSSFPILIYSEVKEHKLSKSALECAVCLNEFEDDETLRLLPNCSHAFHTDCIDAWLAAHITCPVCRCNLTEPVENKDTVDKEHVVIEVEDDEERKREMDELETFVSMKRSARHFRSYTMGHAEVHNLERYTLRLPEHVKSAIMLKRTSSCVVFSYEESEKKGFRTTERLGSFLKRAISMKNGRFFRWDSSKSEASVRSKSSSFRRVISQFDCYPGSSSSVDCNNQLNKVEKLSGTDSSREKD